MRDTYISLHELTKRWKAKSAQWNLSASKLKAKVEELQQRAESNDNASEVSQAQRDRLLSQAEYDHALLQVVQERQLTGSMQVWEECMRVRDMDSGDGIIERIMSEWATSEKDLAQKRVGVWSHATPGV